MKPRPAPSRLRATMDSVLVHDLRNLGQRLELLLSNVDEHYGDPDFKRSVTELLQSTVQKVDSIVAHWSQADPVLIKHPVDLNDLVSEVVRTCRPRGGSGSTAVRLSLGGLGPVWADAYYLREALQSVVQNALEAAVGSVSIETSASRTESRSYAAVVVQDDGAGMSAEFVRRRLFRPFQTTKPGGVGLGLFTTRRIVLHHRGKLEVETGEGRGTRVTLLLPMAPAPARRRR